MSDVEVFTCSNLISHNEHCLSIKKVLIVEDTIFLQKRIAEALTSTLEIECEVAGTEAEAMALLEENSYDLIIVDIYLPDSSGNFVGALIRKQNKIIIITGSENEAERENLVSLSIVDYLCKTDEKTIIDYLIQSVKRLQQNEQMVVAICDDSKLVRLKMIDVLIKQNLAYVEFENGEEAHECIIKENYKVDLLITDINMPKMNGDDLIRHIRHHYAKNELPILSFSSSDKKSTVSQMLKLGANDYINKPFSNEEFITRLNSQLDQLYLYRENKILIAKLEAMTSTDFLTKLYNRNYFYSVVSHMQAQAKRDGHTLGIIMLDIDHFKQVNDNYGHEAGDTALKQVSAVVHESARESDVTCRWGGEEFLILVPKSSLTALVDYAERLRKLIQNNAIIIEPKVLEFSITASLGVAIGKDENIETIIAQADKYLYNAKKSGRNRVAFK